MKRLIFVQFMLLLTVGANAFTGNLRKDLKKQVDGLSSETCVTNMNQMASLLRNLKAQDYSEEIAAAGHEPLLQELWNFKIVISNKYRQFYKDSNLSRECAGATRAAHHAIRATEDIIGENYYRKNQELLENEEAYRAVQFSDNGYEFSNPMVRRNPEFGNIDLIKDLRSGDIILSKGKAFTSAAIASLGEYDTQFSHLSLVYRDPKGKLWTIEAHIEVGTFVRTIEEHIADKNYRSLIFRFDDAEIAAKAAEYMFNKAKNSSETVGNILYDFAFDPNDSSKLFCSEVVSHAYSVASEGKVKIPMFPSRLMERKPEFVKMLDITSNESFIPADIEVDPRFKILTEFKNVAITNEDLSREAIIQAMFKWSDDNGYRMIQGGSKLSRKYRNFAYPLRHLPYLSFLPVLGKTIKDVQKKLPLNMTRSLIGYFGIIDSMGALLTPVLKAENEKTMAVRDIPLLKSEKYDVLNNYRLQDLGLEDPILHDMYRPLPSKE